ncbi:hypothetical protein GLYMA_15G234950v4 [Glycine max]|nr:hypothetical protein GLYMA_15G234950v4 [Glycine max]KAH1148569.1 hypothetical protein GYH30_043277 [Glycine max]
MPFRSLVALFHLSRAKLGVVCLGHQTNGCK